MKYLIKHKKEFTITVVALIVAIADMLKVFGIDMPIDEASVYAVVSVIMGVLCWFYNMPTSKENCEHTGAMRLEKEQNKGKITGENFTDEAEEIKEED